MKLASLFLVALIAIFAVDFAADVPVENTVPRTAAARTRDSALPAGPEPSGKAVGGAANGPAERNNPEDLLAGLMQQYGIFTGNPDWAGFEQALLQRIAAGDSNAALWLGRFYVNPDLPIHNRLRGLQLLESAWRQGEVTAAHELAALYLFEGVERGSEASIAQGMAWMEKAAGMGSVDAKQMLARVYSGTVRELDIKDRERALYWVQDYGASVSPNRQVYVAQDVIRGRNYVRDFNTGIDMLVHAGRRGEPASINDAAWILATCKGETPARLKDALSLMKEEFARYGRTAGSVDTLAAVHARLGNFQRAITMQLEAIRLLEAEGTRPDDSRYAELYGRLELYTSGSTARSDYPCADASD